MSYSPFLYGKKNLIFFSILAFSILYMPSCSKDEEKVQHHFYYKMNNKNGGSAGHNEMTLVNMFFVDNGYTAQNDNNVNMVIYATLGADCGSSGKPNCYDVEIVVPGLTVGTYTLGQNKQGSLQIAEFIVTGIEQYSCDQFSPAGDIITVTISEVGGIGGVVTGSFTGTVGGNALSGEFKVDRLS